MFPFKKSLPVLSQDAKPHLDLWHPAGGQKHLDHSTYGGGTSAVSFEAMVINGVRGPGVPYKWVAL